MSHDISMTSVVKNGANYQVEQVFGEGSRLSVGDTISATCHGVGRGGLRLRCVEIGAHNGNGWWHWLEAADDHTATVLAAVAARLAADPNACGPLRTR